MDAFLRAAGRSPKVAAHVGGSYPERLPEGQRSAEALLWLDRVPADHGCAANARMKRRRCAGRCSTGTCGRSTCASIEASV